MADDPNAREMIARAFNAPPGTLVIGHVDDDGELHVKERKIN